MEYRPFGKTGLKVPILSFGASPLGSVFQQINELEGIEAVHEAIDLGVNYFDTSPYYGLTKSETVLGRALAGIPREKYILATKVGRYGPETFDFSAARVAKSLEESLQRLGVECVDCLTCHDVEFVKLDQIVEETVPALRKLQQQGKVRFIGVSGYPLKTFRSILDRTDLDYVLTYCHYALNDTTLADFVPYLQLKGVGIINASPLSMGLLTDRGVPDWHPAPKIVVDTCKQAAAYCRERGASIAQLALQFAVNYTAIPTTMIGMSSREHLKQNLEWLRKPIDRKLFREVREILRPVWNKTWSSGRPENN